MFKNMVLLFAIFFASQAFSATCTTISRSNYVANQVLTSAALNADLNNIYAPFNSASGAADGGCISDGTLEKAALNSTDYDILLTTPKQGCFVTSTDANTLSLDRCRLAVGGNWIKTTAATTVAMGCAGCSAEAASTKYYLYAKTTSSGSLIALDVSTTAPNADGYDSSDNRVLAKFYNNAQSNIDPLSVAHWGDMGWRHESTAYSAYTMNLGGIGSNPTKGTTTVDNARARRDGELLDMCWDYVQTAAGSVGSGPYTYSLPTYSEIATSKRSAATSTMVGVGWLSDNVVFGTATTVPLRVNPYSATGLMIMVQVHDGANDLVHSMYHHSSANFPYSSTNLQISFCAKMPMAGWD